MPTDQTFIELNHPEVPTTIHLLSMEQKGDLTGSERRDRERRDGDRLLYELLHTCTPHDNWVLDRQDGCKPLATSGSLSAWLSLAHTPDLLAGAVSLEWDIGIDLEPLGRTIPAGLARRILHPDEVETWGVGRDEEMLKLWTLKEAALKQCGTGLRTRMSHVLVLPVRPGRYEISVAGNSPVEGLGWKSANHWISLVWGENNE